MKHSYFNLLFFCMICLLFFFIQQDKIEASNEGAVHQESKLEGNELKENYSPKVYYATEPPSVPLGGLFKIPKGANSYVLGNKVVITEQKTQQIGSVFSTDDNMLDLSQDFTSEMHIKINGRADGVTFIMHNDKSATENFQFNAGYGLSVYATQSRQDLQRMIKNSFVVEFDTYHNSEGYDKSVTFNKGNGHVAYSFPNRSDSYIYDRYGKVQGNVHYGVQYPNEQIGNNKWKKFSINWKKFDSQNKGTLTYTYEGLPPVTVNLSRDIFASDKVYWGFTGSTGASFEQAEVLFSTVPGMIDYKDNLSIVDENNKLLTENSYVKNDSLLTVKYSGEYKKEMSKVHLLNPNYKFKLSPGQKYQNDSFAVNGKPVKPSISGDSLSVTVPDFTEANSKIEVVFKIKTEGLKTLDKPTVNSILSGTNYKQSDGNTVSYRIDSEPPKGIGKLRVIDKHDAGNLENLTEYKELLKDWSDDVTEKDKVIVDLKEGQDIKQIVEVPGFGKITLTLEDEVGNVGYVNVPLYIKEKEELVSNDDTYLIKAENFEIFSGDYPNTNNDLVKMILTESKAELWQANEDGLPQKKETELIEVNTNSLPAVGSHPEPKDYPINLNYKSEKSTVKLPITMSVVKMSTINVEFLDEVGGLMHDPVSLLRTIGETIDLTKEEEVQSAIKKIQNDRYQIYQRPENETALLVPNQDTTVAYRFEGTLFVSSYPTFMNFGVKALQASTPFIRVEKARYNKPLTIWDNRKGTSPWVLTATLEKALTSFEDDKKVLPEAIRYKKDNATTVVLRQGSTEPIMTRKNQESNEVSISDGWDKGNSGLQLEVPTGKVLQTGRYYATILWQVADTP